MTDDTIALPRVKAHRDGTFSEKGYRDRGWDTRAAQIPLEIPELRKGSQSPDLLRPPADGREAAPRGDQRYIRSARFYLPCGQSDEAHLF